MTESPSILIIDEDEAFTSALQEALTSLRYRVVIARDERSGSAFLRDEKFFLVLLGVTPTNISKILQTIKSIKDRYPFIEVIVFVSRGSVKSAFQTIRSGAYEYLVKSSNIEEFIPTIDAAYKKAYRRYKRSPCKPWDLSGEYKPEFIGDTPETKSVLDLATKVASSDAPVLILGKTGVGKELLANYIHQKSRRNTGPFVVINCGAIPEALLENELFGHERGAFTDASTLKRGLLEDADQGTLFLDEISELSPMLQVKLLRAIETGKFRRLGGNKEIRIDVRIISATNKDLYTQVILNRFRADLYYRLAVITINVPSLKERRNDIPVLLDHFLKKFGNSQEKSKVISPGALRMLTEYDWPGNVRELKNVVERLCILSHDSLIKESDVALALPRLDEIKSLTQEKREGGLPTLVEIQKRYIAHVLELTNGDHAQAAEILGILPQTLYDKLKEYEVTPSPSKQPHLARLRRTSSKQKMEEVIAHDSLGGAVYVSGQQSASPK
jgi:DNA-binding NtrC family response regulator